MLSFKPLLPGRSRHVASIDDSEGNTQQLLFFTEVGRKETIPENNFEEELKEYVEEDSTPQDFRVKEQYKLNIVPSNNITGLQRETISVFGKSGSGKSWQIKNYIRNYKLLHPGNNVYFYSLNKLENDPSYDEDLLENITQIDLMSVDCAILPENYKDSLFVFDDVLDVKFSLSPAEVFGLQYRLADIATKSRLERECNKKATSIKSFLNESVKNILNLGRKYNASCIAVYHKLRSGIESTFAVEESSACWLYPYTATKQALHSFMAERLSFSKDDIKAFAKNEEFYQYDFLCINNAGKLFYFTPNHFKFV